MKTVSKRVFMGWVNTKPSHPEDHYKTSAAPIQGAGWVRVYAFVDAIPKADLATMGLSGCPHCGGLMNEAQRYVCGCSDCRKGGITP